jgi:hypothetical protein
MQGSPTPQEKNNLGSPLDYSQVRAYSLPLDSEMEREMKMRLSTVKMIPTWQVRIYAPMFRNVLRNPVQAVVVEAYTGPAAEEAALAGKPGWKVIDCQRLTGFDGMVQK